MIDKCNKKSSNLKSLKQIKDDPETENNEQESLTIRMTKIWLPGDFQLVRRNRILLSRLRKY